VLIFTWRAMHQHVHMTHGSAESIATSLQ